MDRNSDKYGGQKESTRRKLGPHGSVVLFLEVSVGPTKLVPVLRALLVLFNQLMSRSAEDRGQSSGSGSSSSLHSGTFQVGSRRA